MRVHSSRSLRCLVGLLVAALAAPTVAIATPATPRVIAWVDAAGLPPMTATSTTLDVTPASPAAAGTAETLTATVTPAAAGSVQFKDGAATLGDPVPVAAGGKASLPVTLVPGSHSLTAVFTPTDTTAFTSSVSLEVTFVINAAATGTMLDMTPASPAAPGTVDRLTATVTPTVAGSVQFKDGVTTLGDPVDVTGNTASMTTTLGPGSHSLTAVFTPTDTTAFSPSLSPSVAYVVNPAVTTTTLDLTPVSPAAVGTVEMLTATVTPSAAGSVRFDDGTTPLAAPVTVTAGKASMPAVLASGSHSLTAVFTPTDPAAFGPSTSSPVSLTVQ